jgi:hypothetical protein
MSACAWHLRERLQDAAQGNFDPMADIAPIRGLIVDQGCDLESDVVPVVAHLLRDLPRPLKNWGAPWLVRDILAARDQRLAGTNGAPACTVSDPVEAPPPVQRTPAIEWDEFVGGYRAVPHRMEHGAARASRGVAHRPRC